MRDGLYRRRLLPANDLTVNWNPPHTCDDREPAGLTLAALRRRENSGRLKDFRASEGPETTTSFVANNTMGALGAREKGTLL